MLEPERRRMKPSRGSRSKLIFLALCFHALSSFASSDELSPAAQKLYKLYTDGVYPFVLASPGFASEYALAAQKISVTDAYEAYEELRKKVPSFDERARTWESLRRLERASADPKSALEKALEYKSLYERLALVGGKSHPMPPGYPELPPLVLKILESIQSPKSSIRAGIVDYFSETDLKALGNPAEKALSTALKTAMLFSTDLKRNFLDLDRLQTFHHENWSATREEEILKDLRARGLGDVATRVMWRALFPEGDPRGGEPRRLKWKELSREARALYGLMVSEKQTIGTIDPGRISEQELLPFFRLSQRKRAAIWAELEAYDPELFERLKTGDRKVAELGAQLDAKARQLAAARNISLETVPRLIETLEEYLHEEKPEKRPLSQAEIEGTIAARLKIEQERLGAGDPSDPRLKRFASALRNELESQSRDRKARKPREVDYEAFMETASEIAKELIHTKAKSLMEILFELGYEVRTRDSNKLVSRVQLELAKFHRIDGQLAADWGSGPETLMVRSKGSERWEEPLQMRPDLRVNNRAATYESLALMLRKELRDVAEAQVNISYAPNPELLLLWLRDQVSRHPPTTPQGLLSHSPLGDALGPKATALLWENGAPKDKSPMAHRNPGPARRWFNRSVNQALPDGEARSSWPRAIRNVGIGVALAIGLAGAVHTHTNVTRIGAFGASMDPFQTDETILFRLEGRASREPVVEISNAPGEKLVGYPLASGGDVEVTLKTERPQFAENGKLLLATLRDYEIVRVRLRNFWGTTLEPGIDYTLKQTPNGRPVVVFKNPTTSGRYRYEVDLRPAPPKPAPRPIALPDLDAIRSIADRAEREHLPELAGELRKMADEATENKTALTSLHLQRMLEKLGRYSYNEGPNVPEKEWKRPLGGLHRFRRDRFFNWQCAQANRALDDLLRLYPGIDVEQLSVIGMNKEDGTFRAKDLHAQVAAKPAGLPSDRSVVHDATPSRPDPLHPEPRGGKARSAPPTPRGTFAGATHLEAGGPSGTSTGALPPPSPPGEPAAPKDGPVVPDPVRAALSALAAHALEQRRPRADRVGPSAAAVATGPLEPGLPRPTSDEVSSETLERSHRSVDGLPEWKLGLEEALKHLRNNSSYRREVMEIRGSDNFVGSQISELAHMVEAFHRGRATLLPEGWTPGQPIPANGSVDEATGTIRISILGTLRAIGPRSVRKIERVDDVPFVFREVVGKLRERLDDVTKALVEGEVPRDLRASFGHYRDAQYIRRLQDVLAQLDRAPWAGDGRSAKGPAHCKEILEGR